MILLADGFDCWANTDYAIRGWNAAPSNAMVAGRFSGSALATSTALRKAFSTSTSTVYMQCAYQAALNTGVSTLMQTYDGTTVQYSITFDHDNGVFKLWRGDVNGTLIATSSMVNLAVNAWHFIESKVLINSTSGLAMLKFNGATVLNVNGLNSQATANASTSSAGVGGGGVVDSFDDFVVFDSSGTVNNSFLGDCRVQTLHPNADGSNSAWTPSSGTVHYTAVDETTPNSANSVSSNTVNSVDTYAFEDMPVNAIVMALQLNSVLAKSDTGGRSVAPVIRQGTTNYTGNPVNPTASPLFYSQIYELNPATGASFLPAEVNANEAGVKVTA